MPTDLNREGLLPCPFCGGNDLATGGDDKAVYTTCRTCGASGPNEYSSNHSWNREGLEADGLDGYCTDCEHRVKIGPDGRCGAGHGRVILDNPQAYLAHAKPDTAVLVEADNEPIWRNLALQFDGHRILALAHLRALLEDPRNATGPAEAFLKEPPLPGEEVLAERLAALSTVPAKSAEPNPDDVLAARRYIRDWTPDYVKDYIARLASPPAAAGMPEGWVLVPVEPTTQMVDHGLDCISDQYLASDWDEAKELAEDLDPAAIYRAMLAARPADGGN